VEPGTAVYSIQTTAVPVAAPNPQPTRAAPGMAEHSIQIIAVHVPAKLHERAVNHPQEA